MFRIELFVDDKKLPYILWALSGHILGDPKIQPVANAKKTKNGVRAVTSGNKVDMLRQHMKANKLTEIAPPQLRDWCVSIGMRPNSYSNVVRDAIAAGSIKRRPMPGKKGAFTYTLTNKEQAGGKAKN